MANPNPSPATRFQPGNRANPGGRPQTRPITAALLKELKSKGPNGKDTKLALMVWKLVQLALAGDVAAQKAIMDRIEGTAVQAVTHAGPDGGAVELVIRRVPGRADAGDAPAD